MHTEKTNVTITTSRLTKALMALLIVSSQLACDPEPAPQLPPSQGTAKPAAMLSAPTPPTPPARPVVEARLLAEATERPELGILAKRDQTPKGSPKWLEIRAEVIERDGRKILRTSQFAKNIQNASLAQQTATNRARHELTKWLGTPTLEGAVVTDRHWNAKRRLSAARIEIELPASWTPSGRDQAEEQREDAHQP